MCAGTLNGFDRSPAHQFAALFGDPTAVDRGVGFMVFWSKPGPAGQLRSSTKAGHLADLSDEHRGQDRPNTRNSLDRDIARVPTETITGHSGDQLDLTVKACNHSPGRVDPRPACRRQRDSPQQTLPTHTKQ